MKKNFYNSSCLDCVSPLKSALPLTIYILITITLSEDQHKDILLVE